MSSTAPEMLTVEEAAKRLGVSASTVWRQIRSGTMVSVRQRGRRLIPEHALAKQLRARATQKIPPFTMDNPIWRLIGAGRGGGGKPGARDKHAILDQ